MGCGVSRFEPPEGATAAGQQPTTNANVDADDAPPSSADARKNENGANPVGPASRLRGLRKIKADVNAFRRNHHHNHQVAAVVDGSPRTSVSKDGLPLVVVVNKAGGEKTSSAKDGSNRSGGGHREDSIFVSVSSPSFRVYCVKDVFPPLDDHHHHDQQSHGDPHEHYHHKGDEGEKENKIPTNDGSNKECTATKQGRRSIRITSRNQTHSSFQKSFF
ncbi:hypothetical protein LINGRAHAP2_LOCUS9432 [Linum grandiflorum]